MAEEKRELNEQEQALLRQSFDQAQQKVGEEDVEYVLKKGQKTLDDLERVPAFMRQVYRQAKLLFLMLRDWWKKEYQLPWRAVAAITAGLLYVLNPFDLIPDFIPVIGAIDDLFVLGLVVALIRSDLRNYCQAKNLDPKDYGL